MVEWIDSLVSAIPPWAYEHRGNLLLAACLSAAGAFPRVGLGRALTLGLRSYLKPKLTSLPSSLPFSSRYFPSTPVSVRPNEVQSIRGHLFRMERQSFITVTGARGVGTSFLVDSAVRGKFGVITINVSNNGYVNIMIAKLI